MITGFAHICFNVRDLDASLAFYRDKLGLKHAFDFRNAAGERTGVYLKAGPRQFVELFRGTVAARATDQSYKHFCLEVDNAQSTAADLRRKGIEVSEPKLGADQSWQAWISDPDGNRIELHEYTAQSWQKPFVQ